MAVTDPIADMLTRIRNAGMARHDSVHIPSSRMKLYITKILKQEGFIADYEVVGSRMQRQIKIVLKYALRKKAHDFGLKRVSKPGLRVYVQNTEIPHYGGWDFHNFNIKVVL